MTRATCAVDRYASTSLPLAVCGVPSRICEPLEYVGPAPLAMSATGIKKVHDARTKQLFDDVFGN